MTYLKKTLDTLILILLIPSNIVLAIIIVYGIIKHFRKDNMKIINDNEYRHEFISNTLENFRPYGYHISIAFWILIIYITYF